MKDSRINAFIAGIALVAAVLMCAALSYAIGKWSFGNHGHLYTIKFPNATGIAPNAEVKYAGAPCGRVTTVELIPRKDQDVDPRTDLFNCVKVTIDVNKEVELGQDVEPTIKQDGIGIAAKYILLTPGPDHDSPDLAPRPSTSPTCSSPRARRSPRRRCWFRSSSPPWPSSGPS
jgi:ABC-type transporter Mla subunit MlaD